MTQPASAITIRPATAADLRAVAAMLESAHLPTTGLAECLDSYLVAADASGDVVGGAGLEPCGEVALVRSVVVREDRRGTGLGDAVMLAALELARERRLRALYLFTMDKPDFFARFGFVRKPHRAWPEAMRRSTQYEPVDRWDPDDLQLAAMALEPSG